MAGVRIRCRDSALRSNPGRLGDVRRKLEVAGEAQPPRRTAVDRRADGARGAVDAGVDPEGTGAGRAVGEHHVPLDLTGAVGDPLLHAGGELPHGGQGQGGTSGEGQ